MSSARLSGVNFAGWAGACEAGGFTGGSICGVGVDGATEGIPAVEGKTGWFLPEGAAGALAGVFPWIRIPTPAPAAPRTLKMAAR